MKRKKQMAGRPPDRPKTIMERLARLRHRKMTRRGTVRSHSEEQTIYFANLVFA